ncbi:glycosyltransferase [Alkaliphilus transvaalensis]|uniref:glycosyltransferase n=1 Tax=Alkaliphilus transvaalensis TaxID=114628 RepID=UPI000687495C|nr:glycosyltransferase [Alkaliphilus transvaalensis]
MNPSIELCRQLGAKGVKIVYYALKQDFHKFEGIENIELKSYPDEFLPVINYFATQVDKLVRNLIKAIHMLYYCNRELIDFTMKEIEKEKPDLVINDIFAIWGKAAARYHKVPIAIFSSAFLMDPKGSGDPGMLKTIFTSIPTLVQALKLRKEVMKKYNVKCDSPMQIPSDQGEYTIVTTSKKLQPGSENFGSNVKFIGFSKEAKPSDAQRDTIFVSLGSISKSKTFWNKCLEATKDLGYKVVFVLGLNAEENINKELLSDNVTIHTKVSLADYENYIQRSALFINHGGLNSITLSIFYKTPILVCPISMEQYENGKAIDNSNCGKTFKNQKMSVSKLRKAIQSILEDKTIPLSIDECSKELQNSIGFANVADDIIETFNLKDRIINYD